MTNDDGHSESQPREFNLPERLLEAGKIAPVIDMRYLLYEIA
jgi:hypothetical protein